MSQDIMHDLTPTLGKVLPNDLLPSKLVESLNLKRRLVYVLPENLVDAIQQELRDTLKGKDRELEIELAREATRFKAVAFRDGHPVIFRRLAPFPDRVDPKTLQCSHNPVTVASELDRALAPVHEWCQAYLGWLVQDPGFQSDVASLAQAECHCCSPFGAPPPYPAGTTGKYDLMGAADHQQQVRDVCKKWRLDGFETLDLPMPLEPHFTACSPYNENSRNGGAAPFLPDIYPIKGRGEVLDRIRATQAAQDVGHLRGWMDLVSPSSKKSPRLASLARQFRLQHYWRVVNSRYPDELSSKKTHLYRAFAIFLDENDETIRKEVPKLKRCLGVPLSSWL